MDFCILTLYPTTLLSSGIRFFWSILSDCLHKKAHLLQSFIFDFPICMHCIPFLSLTASSTMLRSRDDKTSLPCFCFSGKAFSFLSFSTMLAVDFCRYIYQIEEAPLCSWFTESFYHKLVLDFVKCFFASVDVNM